MPIQPHRALCLLLATCGMLGVGTATAQAGAAEPPRGTSNVNGYPVPVGDQHRYNFEHRRSLVSTNPLGWIFGSWGASLAHGLHPNVAARLDVGVFRPVDSRVRGLEAGVATPIYFRRLYDGMFLEPGVIVRRRTEGGASANTFGPLIRLGWQWIWDSGLNVALAVGVGRNFSSDIKAAEPPSMTGSVALTPAKIDLAEEKVFSSGYLRFGYAF